MSLTWVIDGVDRSTKVEFGTVTDLTTAARGGTRGGGTVIVTDSTGTLNLHGWRPCYAEEPASTTQPRVFTGFIGGKKIRRGPEGPIGPGRVWECSLLDLNAVFHMLVWRGTTAIRPPETNLARVAALLASRALSGLLADTGYVSGTALPFDKADYRNQYADQVLDDITGAVAYDYFAFWDPVAAAASLFFNVRDAAINDSTIKINNFAGAADYSTVFPTGTSGASDDAELDQAGDEVYSGDVYKYIGSEVYVTRPATAAAYIARDNVYETTRIGRQSSALAQAGYFLDSHATEKDVLTIPIRLPASKVGLVAAGQRIQVKLEQLPGYDSGYVWTRIAERRLSQVEVDDAAGGHYDLVLTCTNAAPASGGGTGGTGGFPHQSNPPGIVQHKFSNIAGSLTPDHPVTDGNALLFFRVNRAGTYPTIPSGWTDVDKAQDAGVDGFGDVAYSRLVTKVAASEPTPYIFPFDSEAIFVELEAGTTVDAHVASDALSSASPVLNSGGAITPSTDGAKVMGFAFVGEFFGVSVVPASGVTEIEPEIGRATPPDSPFAWAGYKDVASPVLTAITGTVSGASGHLGSGGVTVVLLGSGSGNPPQPGQWVYDELVTMSGTTGTVAFAFADGSLSIKVDNKDRTAMIASYDGAARTFVLTAALDPAFGQQVFATYQGR